MSELLKRFLRQNEQAQAVIDRLLSGPQYIEQPEARAIAENVFARMAMLEDRAVRELYEEWLERNGPLLADPKRRYARAMDTLTVTDGVAVIDVAGPMFKEAPSLFEMFGIPATSTAFTRLQLRAADERSDVVAKLIRFDTPGGEGFGLEAFANELASGQKPTHAFVEDMCCSAGVWAASGADRISAQSAAMYGSIGAFTTVDDTSKMFEAAGVTRHVIASGGEDSVKGGTVSGTEVKPHVLADIKREINELSELFVRHVADSRDMKKADAAKLETGQVWTGEGALARGLIDAIEFEAEAFAAAKEAGERHAAQKKEARARHASLTAPPLRGGVVAGVGGVVPTLLNHGDLVLPKATAYSLQNTLATAANAVIQKKTSLMRETAPAEGETKGSEMSAKKEVKTPTTGGGDEKELSAEERIARLEAENAQLKADKEKAELAKEALKANQIAEAKDKLFAAACEDGRILPSARKKFEKLLAKCETADEFEEFLPESEVKNTPRSTATTTTPKRKSEDVDGDEVIAYADFFNLSVKEIQDAVDAGPVFAETDRKKKGLFSFDFSSLREPKAKPQGNGALLIVEGPDILN